MNGFYIALLLSLSILIIIMYINYIITTTIVIVLLLIIPIIYRVVTNKLFKNFTFKSIVKTLNQALIYQSIIGVTILLISMILSNSYSDNSDVFTTIFIESSYCYVIVGCFWYLPIIVLINLVNLIIIQIYKRRIKLDD